MSHIHLSELQMGRDLLDDAESYLNDLSEQEMGQRGGTGVGLPELLSHLPLSVEIYSQPLYTRFSVSAAIGLETASVVTAIH